MDTYLKTKQNSFVENTFKEADLNTKAAMIKEASGDQNNIVSRMMENSAKTVSIGSGAKVKAVDQTAVNVVKASKSPTKSGVKTAAAALVNTDKKILLSSVGSAKKIVTPTLKTAPVTAQKVASKVGSTVKAYTKAFSSKAFKVR